jgi:protein tyrosine phosphatase
MFAGEYPGDRDEEVAMRKIAQMHRFGIRHIVDLTEEGELCPYAHLLPGDMTHYRFPIRDVSIPKDLESVRALIERIDELKKLDGYVYIHCWGGVGRTGTIVACYISAHERELDANQVLTKLRGYFKVMPKSSRRKTPDSRSQVGYIKNFVQANVSYGKQC